jgi:hypothetical protein
MVSQAIFGHLPVLSLTDWSCSECVVEKESKIGSAHVDARTYLENFAFS